MKEGHSLYIGGPAGTGKSFLLNKIVTSLRSAGKCVQLTCTTGIACTNFPPALGAMTIHHWSGIHDGRYSSKEVVFLIKNNEKFKYALQRIQLTDTLIIDEVSMLSERLFDQLRDICSLSDPSKLFGGIQLILCGDFAQ
ncbi:DNA repair and recombination protein pif1, mitochondrial [Mizuhopecten yessoensis]|uniref:ATP-dependent DNA helicase n=1 Tax=Mizuhopecten yessoensis TaxID=6573 RepID=A0A210Q141_MIZYE|nr:DNA repair and recombination protein pif1, mitochondrial [Mizuhopecten yessoensis]